MKSLRAFSRPVEYPFRGIRQRKSRKSVPARARRKLGILALVSIALMAYGAKLLSELDEAFDVR